MVKHRKIAITSRVNFHVYSKKTTHHATKLTYFPATRIDNYIHKVSSVHKAFS